MSQPNSATLSLIHPTAQAIAETIAHHSAYLLNRIQQEVSPVEDVAALRGLRRVVDDLGHVIGAASTDGKHREARIDFVIRCGFPDLLS